MFNIINLNCVETLMDEIKKYPLYTFLTAKEQTNGRGKNNRSWISKKSNNLYFAINIKVDKFLGLYSFVSGLALLKSININSNVKLKWPNDLLINNKKVSGILLEKCNDNLIIGIGLNIDYYPENTNFLSTSLNNEGIIISKDEIINRFIDNFIYLQKNMINFGFNTIKNEWLLFAYKIKEEIKVNFEGEEYIGIFNGIDEDGSLILDINNEIKKIYSADVFDI